jgi:hypothetical protein
LGTRPPPKGQSGKANAQQKAFLARIGNDRANHWINTNVIQIDREAPVPSNTSIDSLSTKVAGSRPEWSFASADAKTLPAAGCRFRFPLSRALFESRSGPSSRFIQTKSGRDAASTLAEELARA